MGVASGQLLFYMLQDAPSSDDLTAFLICCLLFILMSYDCNIVILQSSH